MTVVVKLVYDLLSNVTKLMSKLGQYYQIQYHVLLRPYHEWKSSRKSIICQRNENFKFFCNRDRLSIVRSHNIANQAHSQELVFKILLKQNFSTVREMQISPKVRNLC